MSEHANSKLENAITSVLSDVRRLAKDHDNAFAKFKYTSVDDFKDHLRPILARAGLRVSMDEIDCKALEMQNDKGQQKPYLRFVFACQVHHISGLAGEPEGITVVLPFVGAQTTGQARSYALKEYLKTAFMASSGDSEDADQTPDGVTLSKAEARSLYTDLQKGMEVAAKDGAEALKKWASLKKPSFDILPDDWRALMRARYTELIGNPNAKPDRQLSDAFDVEDFLIKIEEALGSGETEDTVIEAWDALDVEATLTGSEDDLSRAFAIRKAKIDSLNVAVE